MSKVIRDTFIGLHSSNLLEKLHEEVRFSLILRFVAHACTLPLKFKDRYKGFKVPITNLKTGTLLKNLRKAGGSLKESLIELEAKWSAEEKENVEEAEDSTSIETKTKASKAAEGPCDVVYQKKKLGRPSKADRKLQDSYMVDPKEIDAKFIDLVDLLPPLPKKGGFDVGKIKKSQYFFS